jgi:hypothetical protein
VFAALSGAPYHAAVPVRSRVATLAGVLAAAIAASSPGAETRPPAKPAEVMVRVAPEAAAPGEHLRVRLDLAPIPGVKINRYPKVQLLVPGVAGLVAEASAAVGNDAPPPPDKTKTNYFDGFDGLEVDLALDPAASTGQHVVEGKLVFYYCMPASGFCAPHRAPIKIPLTVR